MVSVLVTGEDLLSNKSGIEPSIGTAQGAQGSDGNLYTRSDSDSLSPFVDLVLRWLSNWFRWLWGLLNVVVDNNGWLDQSLVTTLDLWVDNATHLLKMFINYKLSVSATL